MMTRTHFFFMWRSFVVSFSNAEDMDRFDVSLHEKLWTLVGHEKHVGFTNFCF